MLSSNKAPPSNSEASDIPVSNMPVKIFPRSSFFVEKRAAALPLPGEIRSLNEATGHLYATNFNRPTPVTIPSLKLLVKYGTTVSIAEIETQIFLHEQLQRHVPIPEVFGYDQDGGQTFLYMALIEGDTLQERFANLTEVERQVVCAELRQMVSIWRQDLRQDDGDSYIGITPISFDLPWILQTRNLTPSQAALENDH